MEDFRIKNNKSTASNIPSRLYFNQNIRKRVLVYINGQTPEKAKYFNESRFEDLNEAVKNEFMLNKPVKYFFTNLCHTPAFRASDNYTAESFVCSALRNLIKSG